MSAPTKKITIEPIMESGDDVIASNPRIVGWRMRCGAESKAFGFRSEALTEASAVAQWHDGPVTIEVTR